MKTDLGLAAVAVIAIALASQATAQTPVLAEGAAAQMTQTDGSIVMTTEDYQRDWALLGIFAHLGDGGTKQFNVVYTQPETVTAYRESGLFPPGAVLIKELRHGVTKDDGDEKVSSLGELTGWFVLIKPPETGAPQGPLWGDGWGWAKFNVDAPDATITKNYQSDCIACHLPVKDTDWVHVEAYPAIRE